MIAEFDDDNDGQINYEEFLTLLTKNRDTTFEEMGSVFKKFDKDGNKKVSFEDLKFIMNEIGEDLTDEELNDMIKVAKADGEQA